MTSPLSLHSAEALLDAFTQTINEKIYPVSAGAVAGGSKLFGAAILLKKDLSVVIADTNQESDSPLWHGETWTIAKFFEIPRDKRPDVKDCLFLTTHEPCSLCLRWTEMFRIAGPQQNLSMNGTDQDLDSAITWSGFDNFTYLYTYEETHHIFECHGDLDIFAGVFYRSPTDQKAAVASPDGQQKQVRPEYKLQNDFFVALSFAELVAAIEDTSVRKEWVEKVEKCKSHYGRLSPQYRRYYGLKDEE